MNKNFMPLAVGVLLVLTGIAGFSVYQYIVSQKEKFDLQAELARVQQEIGQLEVVRNNLSSDLDHAREVEQALVLENTGLKSQIKDDQLKFTMLEAAIVEAQNNIDTLSGQISIARQENTALVSQIDEMRTRLSTTAQENYRMAATLNSLDGLKKAIKELRHKTRAARRSAPVRVVADAKKQVREILLGNQGYIIRDGKVMTPARVKIEVQASAANN